MTQKLNWSETLILYFYVFRACSITPNSNTLKEF